MGKARGEPDAWRHARRVRVGGPGKRSGGDTGTAPWADLTTAAHVSAHEGCPAVRPFTREELQVFFDHCDAQECRGCGRVRPVNARGADGAALCPGCYEQPPDLCSACGERAVIVSRLDDRSACARCYRHPRRECGSCGRVRRVAVLGRNGQPDLCPTCHQAPLLTCGVCGVHDRCRTTTADRSPICFRCQLARRLDQVLADSHGGIPAALVALREAILAVDNPRTALGWLGRSPAITVLTAVARGEQPLTHATLDAAAGPRRGRAFAVEHLRQLLVACGALPDRDRHLARLEIACDELVAAAHPDDRQVLRTYATWRLLHRLRGKGERGQPTQAAAQRAHELTSEAARFLAWLLARDISLIDVTQADLDAWLAVRSRARSHLIGFLKWARDRRLVGGSKHATQFRRIRSGSSPTTSAGTSPDEPSPTTPSPPWTASPHCCYCSTDSRRPASFD